MTYQSLADIRKARGTVLRRMGNVTFNDVVRTIFVSQLTVFPKSFALIQNYKANQPTFNVNRLMNDH